MAQEPSSGNEQTTWKDTEAGIQPDKEGQLVLYQQMDLECGKPPYANGSPDCATYREKQPPHILSILPSALQTKYFRVEKRRLRTTRLICLTRLRSVLYSSRTPQR